MPDHLGLLGNDLRFTIFSFLVAIPPTVINTLESDSEMLITILGAFAQAESESISGNVVWVSSAYTGGSFAETPGASGRMCRLCPDPRTALP